MRTDRKQALLEYGLGIPIAGFFYVVLSLAFVGHGQLLADSGATTVPWYYLFPVIFIELPFLVLLNISDWWRPVFGTDNAAMFAMIALDAIFWSFLIVFGFRFVRKFMARHKTKT
jgi:hypothetical protein